MTWVKIDDGFFRHPKIRAAGRDARDLYLAALCYCNENLTDGFVPDYEVRRLSAEADTDDTNAALTSLCNPRSFGRSLWTTAPGGYIVHDYHDYQPSRADVLRLKEVRAEAGSRGGRRAAQGKETPLETASETAEIPPKEAVAEQLEQQNANQNAEQSPNHVANQFASQNEYPVSRIPYSVSRVPESERVREAAPPPRPPSNSPHGLVAGELVSRAGERFAPPTEAEAAAYFASKNFPQCAEAFWTYWQARGWQDAQDRPIRNWHMAARNWITKERPPGQSKKRNLGAGEAANVVERQLGRLFRPHETHRPNTREGLPQ